MRASVRMLWPSLLAFALMGNALRVEGAVVCRGSMALAAVLADPSPASPAETKPGGGPPSGPPNSPPGQPPQSGQPGQPGGPQGEGPKPVQRPPKPTTPPKPEELNVVPDENGQVRLNFNGQPWPGVLEWLAKISGMSLDWLELPGDYLNCSTQRSYSVEETRDLINMHLLARGFTLLRQGDVLHVVNIKKLDPSLVPRLEPAELESRSPHEFVKVSFAMDTVMADTVVEELKPMISPNGKLSALSETNRIEAMDAVLNLREVYGVLKDEQSAENRNRSIRDFRLKHARADDVRNQLISLLGIDSKASSVGGPPPGPDQGPQTPREQPGKSKRAVTLVVNEHRNSILAHAPPDKMLLIGQAIEAIDVPGQSDSPQTDNASSMQVYRVLGIELEPVVKTLEQMGTLDLATRLEIDKKNKAIIAYASPADHETIRATIAKLNGSERSFEVRRLRRLPADYVAGTIAFMLGVQPKKEKSRSRPWYDFQPERETPAERPNEFRVDADLERNRLLLWANAIELAEVDKLLVKLGEIATKGPGPENVRVIEVDDPQKMEELLEHLRRQWPSVSPNPLHLPPAPKPADSEATPPENRSEEPQTPPTRTTSRPRSDSVFRLAQLRTETAEQDGADVPAAPANPSPEKPLPPVNVRILDNGDILVSSDDPQALDRLEELAADFITPHKDYKLFSLKFALAYNVAMNLDDFFRTEEKPKSRNPWSWWGDSGDDSQRDDLRLSTRRKLKFIADDDMNCILVQGADATQLKTIEELIKVFDQRAPKDSDTDRKTEVIQLRYAKASEVAEAVKDVYRDLLSDNDKALAGGQKENQRTIVYDWGSSPSDKTKQKVPKFKGLLSIGINASSNSLVVSAPVFLFDYVRRMVEELDEAAADNTVRVVKVAPGVSAARLQELLGNVLDSGSSRGKGPAKRATPPSVEPPKPKTDSTFENN